jgi:hypothetical protein
MRLFWICSSEGDLSVLQQDINPVGSILSLDQEESWAAFYLDDLKCNIELDIDFGERGYQIQINVETSELN